MKVGGHDGHQFGVQDGGVEVSHLQTDRPGTTFSASGGGTTEYQNDLCTEPGTRDDIKNIVHTSGPRGVERKHQKSGDNNFKRVN